MSAGAGYDVTSIVVEQFVSTAVTDIDTDVRLVAVQMLDTGSCFHTHLSKAQNVQALFLLTSDELLEIKLTILSIIGHVLAINPAHVLPSLRRMVIQLLTELEYACSNHERDECAQMIMMLVKSANHWIHPYVGDIFLTIMPCIDNGIPQLASKLLDTIATLAQIGGNVLIPYTDTLLASIVQALSDSSSSQKRLSALRALGSCASFCGMVIDPYTDYPQLLGILTKLLKSESDETKEETMRVIGSLGAIDSRRYRDAIAHVSTLSGSANVNSSGNSTSTAGSSATALAAAGTGVVTHVAAGGNTSAFVGM
ncbi:phosphatidylinositol kinase- protein kinase tor1, partial [Coemansia sp. RSA 2603]